MTTPGLITRIAGSITITASEAAELLGTIVQSINDLPNKQEAAWRKAQAQKW